MVLYLLYLVGSKLFDEQLLSRATGSMSVRDETGREAVREALPVDMRPDIDDETIERALRADKGSVGARAHYVSWHLR